MKNSKKGLIAIIILSIIILSFITALIIKNINKKDYLIDLTYNELREKIDNKETFILYIGKEGCSACASFDPKFNKVLNKYKIEAYYIDLETFSDSQKEYIVNNISFTGTPTVVFMIEGIDSLNSDTKIIGNVDESKIITKLKNRGYIE